LQADWHAAQSSDARSKHPATAGSAAIDAGVDAGIGFDLDGNSRPFGIGFDIGYDEYAIWKVFLPVVRR
jgi:hypothetical protein